MRSVSASCALAFALTLGSPPARADHRDSSFSGSLGGHLGGRLNFDLHFGRFHHGFRHHGFHHGFQHGFHPGFFTPVFSPFLYSSPFGYCPPAYYPPAYYQPSLPPLVVIFDGKNGRPATGYTMPPAAQRPSLSGLERLRRDLVVEQAEAGVFYVHWRQAAPDVLRVEYEVQNNDRKTLTARVAETAPFRALVPLPEGADSVVVTATFKDGSSVAMRVPAAEFRRLGGGKAAEPEKRPDALRGILPKRADRLAQDASAVPPVPGPRGRGQPRPSAATTALARDVCELVESAGRSAGIPTSPANPLSTTLT